MLECQKTQKVVILHSISWGRFYMWLIWSYHATGIKWWPWGASTCVSRGGIPPERQSIRWNMFKILKGTEVEAPRIIPQNYSQGSAVYCGTIQLWTSWPHVSVTLAGSKARQFLKLLQQLLEEPFKEVKVGNSVGSRRGYREISRCQDIYPPVI